MLVRVEVIILIQPAVKVLAEVAEQALKELQQQT
jgi:hypothetical protein